MIPSASLRGAGRPLTGEVLRSLKIILATLGGNLFIVLGSVVFGSLAILGSWAPQGDRWVFRMARYWSRGLLAASGLRLEVTQPVEVEASLSYVFMPNHQSLYDIPAMIATLPVPAFFFAKRSLFQIPIFGWALSAGGFVSIDRKDRSSARQSFAKAVASLQKGRSTVIYPEGTRSLDGRLLSFERGGFLLAIKSGAAIVPAGIRGSLNVRKRDGWIVTPGTIKVAYGKAVETSEYTVRTRGELIERVKSDIAALSGSPEG